MDRLRAAAASQLAMRRREPRMDFDIPADLAAYLDELDEFIEREIRPLERHDDNIRFFDHRREDARTDWDRARPAEPPVGGTAGRGPAPGRPRPATTGTRSPRSTAGGTAPTWAWQSSASIWPARASGLHCDLQNEHMIVGNNVGLLLMIELRQPAAAGRMDRRAGRRAARASRSASPSPRTARTRPSWKQPQCATATAG